MTRQQTGVSVSVNVPTNKHRKMRSKEISVFFFFAREMGHYNEKHEREIRDMAPTRLASRAFIYPKYFLLSLEFFILKMFYSRVYLDHRQTTLGNEW